MHLDFLGSAFTSSAYTYIVVFEAFGRTVQLFIAIYLILCNTVVSEEYSYLLMLPAYIDLYSALHKGLHIRNKTKMPKRNVDSSQKAQQGTTKERPADQTLLSSGHSASSSTSFCV